MTSERAGAALIAGLRAGRLRDPVSERTLDLAIRRIAIEPSLEGRATDLLAGLDLPERLAVISDETTREVMGRRIERALGLRGQVDSITLERPKADLATALGLIPRTSAAGGLVAVGSGTLNDLVKYAAFASRRPYVVFATAPSMNGYVTTTVSLAVEGLKSTLPAACPKAALFDLGVLRTAPVRLIRAGLGDVVCRTTAQVDWLLAHFLFGSAYDERPFHLQAADEPPLLSTAAALGSGDPDAVARLTRLLILSGLGMALAGSSAPASQGEHLISHYLDSVAGERHPGSLHGEQVGVATLTMSRLQHRLLGADRPPVLKPTPIDEDAIRRTFGPAMAASCIQAMRAKALNAEWTARINRKLEREWDQITRRLRPVMLPAATLDAALQAAGAPRTALDLGFDPAFYREAVMGARLVRERFTCLDLAADAGLLAAVVAAESSG